MKHFKFTAVLAAAVFLFGACHSVKNRPSLDSNTVPLPYGPLPVAPTPPMGWNSFDAYDCRINEAEFKATVDYMAEKMLPFGWEYAVIDYIWWHPEPGNWDTPRRKGHPNIRYKENGEPLYPEEINMDEYGRLLPAVNRFPSAANGKGFKPLADYVHSKGMKFGIHIMRGIHRYAYFKDCKIMGSTSTAKMIGEPQDTCDWCNHMYGVDASVEGSQAYYNSLFKLYAEWGVDFIKADDMMAHPYHKGEIEMMHKAIAQCGRPMVLSLSCGEAPVSQAPHVSKYANMWRISADFWDRWSSLEHNFDLLNAWSPFIKENAWPDADMLPIGKLSLDDRPHGPERISEFTIPEHYTLMTLWSIARSPLMVGADLLSTPESIVQTFLCNKDVLTVNQKSTDNRQLIKNENKAIWVATDPKTGDRYVALFNLLDQESTVRFDLEDESMRGKYTVKDLWSGKDLGIIAENLKQTLPAHGAGLYRLSPVR